MEKLLTIMILYLLALSIAVPTAHGFDKRPKAVRAWLKNLPNLKEKVARFHFYLHDMNPKTYTVAQAKISATSPTDFGLIRMMDDPLTVGPEPDSKIIGRAQGINGGASFEEIGLLMNFNFLFLVGKYNGSTLSVLGRDAILDEYREMPIVGGTGVFRLARGIATVLTVWFNRSSQEAVIELSGGAVLCRVMLIIECPSYV